jgi:DNA-binding response OmpR family regulator
MPELRRRGMLVKTHIYRLRRKMEIDPAKCRILVTEGGGYQLNAA